MPIPATLIENAKTQFDLTETADQHSLYQLTEKLLALPLDEVQTAARQPDAPLEFKIAAKLVDSRQFLLANQQPVKIGLVFAMWGEQNRLRPKTADNPNGEDALRVKLHQLDWATTGYGRILATLRRRRRRSQRQRLHWLPKLRPSTRRAIG